MSPVHNLLARTRTGLNALMSLTLALAALAASGAAWADPPGRVGRLGEMQGTVWLFDDYDGEWIQARRNRPVTEGDRVSSERGARAEIEIGSATLRLDGATDVEFTELNDERVRIRLHGGTVALRARGDSSREFAILVPEGRFEPMRAGRYRVDRKDDASYGAALAGALRFEARDSALEISAGQRAELWVEGGMTHYAWAAMPDDRFGDWVAREDRDDDRERRRYVSPEMTGSEDLDRYGRWDRHPDYGAIWYPTTVVGGWAPYRYGHWAYVNPWGWTWVDDAPWGFAPFHYGRWVSYGGRWGWCPGQYVARPVYAPALVAWFGGPNVSVGISVGGGPAVGWVPLAPREYYYPTYQVTNIYVRNVNVTHQPWLPKQPPRTVPTGPIMYTNQGVAGGVTVVSKDVLRNRQPISSSVIVPVDPRTVSSWQRAGQQVVQQQQGSPRGGQDHNARVPVMNAAPPPPQPSRVVTTPGGAVPAAPGAVRNVPWSSAARAVVGGSDGGEAQPRARVPSPAATQQRQAAPPVVARPQAPAAPQAQPPQRPPTVQAVPAQPAPPRAEREVRPDRRERGADREQPPGQDRRATPQPVPPSVQPVQPGVRPAQPAVRPVQPLPVPGRGHGGGREEAREQPQQQQQRAEPREEQRRRGFESRDQQNR